VSALKARDRKRRFQIIWRTHLLDDLEFTAHAHDLNIFIERLDRGNQARQVGAGPYDEASIRSDGG
jgi:hypothetical protein